MCNCEHFFSIGRLLSRNPLFAGHPVPGFKFYYYQRFGRTPLSDKGEGWCLFVQNNT
jgi:hypothetical protein